VALIGKYGCAAGKGRGDIACLTGDCVSSLPILQLRNIIYCHIHGKIDAGAFMSFPLFAAIHFASVS
jgi:hypothetical protein